MAAQISETLASSVGLRLGGEFVVLQAPIFEGLAFDAFTLLVDGTFLVDGLGPARVAIGRCDVVQALVIVLMVVMLDDCFNLLLKVAGSHAASP
jgi:hypothetical protein